MNKFEESVREKYRSLTLFLIEKGLTITTMESCTSGQIASLITDTEGSSAVMRGAFVTYSNEAKLLQGVPEAVIAEYGVYSCQTSEEMARAALRAYPSNIGIGVTGTMGNVDPANKDSQPGQVYFSIVMDGKVNSYERTINPRESRYEYKLAVAELIYDELAREFLL